MQRFVFLRAITRRAVTSLPTRINTRIAAGARFISYDEKDPDIKHFKAVLAKRAADEKAGPQKRSIPLEFAFKLYQRAKAGKYTRKVPTPPVREPSTTSPPIKREIYFSGTLGKYTHALFNAASKTNELEKVEKDLMALVAGFKNDSKLQSQLTSPIVSKPQKQQLISSVCQRLGTSTLVSQLAQRLVEENRIKELPTLASNFSSLLADKRGHVAAVVYSAAPLTTEQIQRIEGKISKLLEPGQKLVLTTQLNPKLLGGLKVRLGDKELDLSVASKIKSFERVFRASLA